MSTITTEVALPRTETPRRRRWIRWLAGIVAVVLVIIAIDFFSMLRTMADENTPPPDLDVSRTRQSAQGLYRGAYTPSMDPLTIDKLHSWTLHLETPDGEPVENATIAVHGDMPGHGHGLPTKPIVSAHRGNGDYLVEGMKFQMTGWWYVEFDVEVDGERDTLRFDFVLK